MLQNVKVEDPFLLVTEIVAQVSYILWILKSFVCLMSCQTRYDVPINYANEIRNYDT